MMSTWSYAGAFAPNVAAWNAVSVVRKLMPMYAYICEEDIEAALIVEGFLAQASDGILVSCVRLLDGNLGGNS